MRKSSNVVAEVVPNDLKKEARRPLGQCIVGDIKAKGAVARRLARGILATSGDALPAKRMSRAVLPLYTHVARIRPLECLPYEHHPRQVYQVL